MSPSGAGLSRTGSEVTSSSPPLPLLAAPPCSVPVTCDLSIADLPLTRGYLGNVALEPKRPRREWGAGAAGAPPSSLCPAPSLHSWPRLHWASGRVSPRTSSDDRRLLRAPGGYAARPVTPAHLPTPSTVLRWPEGTPTGVLG